MNENIVFIIQNIVRSLYWTKNKAGGNITEMFIYTNVIIQSIETYVVLAIPTHR